MLKTQMGMPNSDVETLVGHSQLVWLNIGEIEEEAGKQRQVAECMIVVAKIVTKMAW